MGVFQITFGIHLAGMSNMFFSTKRERALFLVNMAFGFVQAMRVVRHYDGKRHDLWEACFKANTGTAVFFCECVFLRVFGLI